MFNQLMKKPNEETGKVCKKNVADKLSFGSSEEKTKCLFGLLVFQRLCLDKKQPIKKLWYVNFLASKIYNTVVFLTNMSG